MTSISTTVAVPPSIRTATRSFVRQIPFEMSCLAHGKPILVAYGWCEGELYARWMGKPATGQAQEAVTDYVRLRFRTVEEQVAAEALDLTMDVSSLIGLPLYMLNIIEDCDDYPRV